MAIPSSMFVDPAAVARRVLSQPVLVAGAGVSGAGCARMLAAHGASVTVADDNEIARQRVHEATGADDISVAAAIDCVHRWPIVVTSPGWRPDSPLLVAAQRAGSLVIGDIELAWLLDQAGLFAGAHTWLAVTGTNGKTTTTAMCAAMLTAAGISARAVGNIGVPVGEALTASPRVDVLVCELSSFQLYWTDHFTPDAGVVLNIADDHLDWHGSLAGYAAAKTRALRGSVAVVGADCPAAADCAAAIDRPHQARRVVSFTAAEPAPGQLGVVDGMLVDRAFDDRGLPAESHATVLASAEGISPAGPAGVYDALAAAALARSVGVSSDAVAQALSNFSVAGHRGQVVAHTPASDDAAAIAWVDNSKATNPHAAAAALAGFDRVVWLAGGQLKGADVVPLIRDHAHRLAAAVLIGCDKHIIADALAAIDPTIDVVVIDDTDPHSAMATACAAANSAAQAIAAVDTTAPVTVLLAPAAASLDMYEGMGQRGDLFAAHARDLSTQPAAKDSHRR